MPRTALVAGAVGRLGEAVLNHALAGDAYHEVVALAQAPMNLGIRRLSLAGPDALPRVDDLYLVLSEADEPAARSFYGRDAAFAALTPDRLTAVARAARQAGAIRALLLSPLPAWQQMSRFHHGLSGDVELQLAGLTFESLTILRPAKTASSSGGGLLERVVGLYLSVQLMMLPRSIPTLTSDQLARAAIHAQLTARPGLRILDAAGIDASLRAERDG